jgi:hypothetical protein
MPMAPKRKKRLVAILAAAVLVSAYPAFVLGYTWSHVFRSDLPGGRDGPLDAYRHALASAVVAFTLSPKAVEWATWGMERKNRSSNLMDRHNNRIGASIGVNAASFGEIEPAVRSRVSSGAVNSPDADQVTWLPRYRWRSNRLW